MGAHWASPVATLDNAVLQLMPSSTTLCHDLLQMPSIAALSTRLPLVTIFHAAAYRRIATGGLKSLAPIALPDRHIEPGQSSVKGLQE